MILLADFAVRSSIILAAGLLLGACLRSRSAAFRHRVLAASMLAAVVVMPLGALLPEWNVSLPAPAPEPEMAPIALTEAAVDRAGGATQAAPVPAGARLSPLLLVWLAGVCVVGGALAAALNRVRRVAARAARMDDEAWTAKLESIARRYGLTRTITVARTESPELLATWGILRPQVLVPSTAADWTPDRVHVVLSHELAHIRRHDWLVQMIAEALRAVLWFNPLAWLLCAHLRRESEQACDDEVLGVGVGAPDYAGHLLDLARQFRRPGVRWASAMPMAHPSTLEKRIAAMLNPGLDRQVPSRRAMAMLALALLLVTLPVAAVRARQPGPAALSGTVYDPTGAVIPGVEVSLADTTQVLKEVRTDASGRFDFGPLAAGKYVLEAKLAGFRTLRHEFELAQSRDWSRSITLQVGELRETILVRNTRTSAPPQERPGSKPQPVRVGGNIRAPNKVVNVNPVYPASMRAAGLSGVVRLEAVVGTDGAVSTVRVLGAHVHPDFAIAAVDAVRQWKFTPTLLNGQPVDVVINVSISFDLEN